MACFYYYFSTFSSYMISPSSINAAKSLLKYVNILHNLKQVKGESIHYVKFVVRSMVSFLYYVRYKESNKANLLHASKRLIQKSLHLDNFWVKLSAATFFLTNLEYRQSNEMCDTFFIFPPRQKVNGEYINAIGMNVLEQFTKVKTTAEIENIMTEILPMFYSSVKLKALPESYDITQQNLVWIFTNFTNLFFHDLCIDVTFMTAEKWVVLDPIQYELLLLP